MELILSLDPSSTLNVKNFLSQIKPLVEYVKIGHILGSQGIEKYISELNEFKLFLDFKFLDIPNTVALAIKNYKKVFPSLQYYTIHGIAEDNMIKACLEFEGAIPLSVIQLSSNQNSSNDALFLNQVERNFKLGITHFVCPPNQVQSIKKHFPNTIIFVPGIRNDIHQNNDHFSTISFKDAKQQNVNFAIVGRPILESENPFLTIEKMLKN